jgi:hypothetical protein
MTENDEPGDPIIEAFDSAEIYGVDVDAAREEYATALAAFEAVRRALLPEHIVSGTELRRLLGNITRATLIAWRRDRGVPEPVKQLEREAVWDIREVRAWMRKR